MQTINEKLPFEKIEDSIKQLDLGPIKYKLVYEYDWSREEADAMEIHYKAFLHLAKKYPKKAIVPSKKLDEMWHMHILDTQKYTEDCQNIFGKLLHHFPYFGLRGTDDAVALAKAFTETAELFMTEFGIQLLSNTTTNHIADCSSSSCGTSCGSSCSDYISYSEIRPVY